MVSTPFVWMLKPTAFDEPPASARDRQRVLEAQCPAGRQLQLRAILVGRVRYTVDEDRTFLPFEWNAAEPCDQEFIGPRRRRSWRPDLYAAPVWGVDGGHVPA